MHSRRVWIASDSIVSPLGLTSKENYQNIRTGTSGISLLSNTGYTKEPVYAAWIKENSVEVKDTFTRFESLCIHSVENALKETTLDPSSPRVIFILSTTKGNIELLEDAAPSNKRIHLHEAAKAIAGYFGNEQQPIVISNACISGVMAVLVAKRLLQANQYDHAIVIGADVLTRFVISGFQSLQAISAEACRPFDSKRKGVNLGEAAATIILTASTGTEKNTGVEILGGGLSNDANHISGPSRTGEELAAAVNDAIANSHVEKDTIDFISAHGTATLYNDEMEAKAFNYAGLSNVPLNSLKGYFGHTLGAAGVVEIIMSKHALLNNELIPTFGFQALGVSQPVNVISKIEFKNITTCLKTASGFGGCNAAVVFSKTQP